MLSTGLRARKGIKFWIGRLVINTVREPGFRGTRVQRDKDIYR